MSSPRGVPFTKPGQGADCTEEWMIRMSPRGRPLGGQGWGEFRPQDTGLVHASLVNVTQFLCLLDIGHETSCAALPLIQV